MTRLCSGCRIIAGLRFKNGLFSGCGCLGKIVLVVDGFRKVLEEIVVKQQGNTGQQPGVDTLLLEKSVNVGTVA